MSEHLNFILVGLIQGLLTFFAGFLAAGLLRIAGRPREECRLLWCGVWLMAAVLPFVSPLAPKWHWPKDDIPRGETMPSTTATIPVEVMVPPDELNFTISPTLAVPDKEVERFDAAGTAPRSSWRPSYWLALVWAAGAVFLACRLLLSRILLGGMTRRCRPAAEPWQKDCAHIAQALGLRRMPRLFCFDEAALPMAWGCLRPAIVIPAWTGVSTSEQRRFVLWHECQHVGRRDACWLTLAQWTLCLHWVNPLAWIALRKLRLAQEQTCDDGVVTGLPDSAARYADFLLQSARAHAAGRPALFQPLSLAMLAARDSLLKQRLTHILNPDMKRTAHKRHRLGIVLLIAAASAGLATLGGQTKTPSDENTIKDAARDAAAMDEALGEKLNTTRLAELTFQDASLQEVFDFFKAELAKLNVNVVVLREARENAGLMRGQRKKVWDSLIHRQGDEAEEARLRMLDMMDRFRISPHDELSGHGAVVTKTEDYAIEAKLRLTTEMIRLEHLLELDGEAFVRHLRVNDSWKDPSLEEALENHKNARREIELASGLEDVVLNEQTKERFAPAQVQLAQEIEATKESLKARQNLLRNEMDAAKALNEREKAELFDYVRSSAEYDENKRTYERELRALNNLLERRLAEELESLGGEAPAVTLDLGNVPLADAMQYALQLGGLNYRLRPNTVVIGTPEELDAF